ncbi:MAG: hypothetical protein II956_00645 [Bacteroidales bacterium]|nr:hypothetical protein [Bacteroidales bacterium]
MKKIYKFSAVATMAVAMLCGTACQEEEEVKVSNETITNVVVNKDSVLTVDGKRMEWKFSLPERKKSISKGILYGRDYYNELADTCKKFYGKNYELFKTITYTHKRKNGTQQKHNIQLMRVDRKTEPGKYFYVMVYNLDVELDTACWAYGETKNILYTYNATKYGRLYTWDAANALAKKISIVLNNRRVHARLMSKQDIEDIMECGNAGYYGYTIDDNIDAPEHEDIGLQFNYYDVFIGGLDGPTYDEEPDYSRGARNLGGFRNTVANEYYFNNWYENLNQVGMYWLKDAYFPEYSDCHGIFVVDYNNDNNYAVSCQVDHLNQYGFSVRYVFEPK